MLFIFLIFYVVLLCLYVLSSVLNCPLRFCIKKMFGLYQLFVVRLMSYLHYLCLFMVVSNTYFVVVVFFWFCFSSFCVSYVASFYGLSIYNYLCSILSHLFTCTRIQCLSLQKYGVRNRSRRGVLDTILCNHFVECSVRDK